MELPDITMLMLFGFHQVGYNYRHVLYESFMTKKIVYYPFLFVLYLILNLVITNQDQLDPALAFPPLNILLLSTAFGIIVFAFILKDWHYAGYLVFLVLVFLFVFGHISRSITDWFPEQRGMLRLGLLFLWTLLIVLLAFKKTWLAFGAGSRVTPVLNGFLTISVAIQLLLGLGAWIQDSMRWSELTGSPIPWDKRESQVSLDCQNRPDIYYIIVDGYGREDVLQEIYGIDNSEFLGFLQESGFHVIDQAHSNYTQTVYSLSSSLNLNYLGSKPEELSPQKYFSSMIANNRLLELLEQCDYQTISIEAGFFYTNRVKVDAYLTQGPHLNEFAALLLSGSPIDVLAQQFMSRPGAGTISYQSHRDWILFNFESLDEIPAMPGPKFVFSHILAPHPPFVFDANGNPVEPSRDYQIVDGSEFAGDWDEYRTGYKAQVQFIDEMLAGTIDTILKKSSTPPIIIIQGDHGPGSLLNWESVEDTCLWERTAILNAYYLPDGGSALLYPEITPVNSFRIILDHYLGTDLALLPDRTAFSSFALDQPIIDVTSERDSKENCSPP